MLKKFLLILAAAFLLWVVVQTIKERYRPLDFEEEGDEL